MDDIIKTIKILTIQYTKYKNLLSITNHKKTKAQLQNKINFIYYKRSNYIAIFEYFLEKIKNYETSILEYNKLLNKPSNISKYMSKILYIEYLYDLDYKIYMYNKYNKIYNKNSPKHISVESDVNIGYTINIYGETKMFYRLSSDTFEDLFKSEDYYDYFSLYDKENNNKTILKKKKWDYFLSKCKDKIYFLISGRPKKVFIKNNYDIECITNISVLVNGLYNNDIKNKYNIEKLVCSLNPKIPFTYPKFYDLIINLNIVKLTTHIIKYDNKSIVLIFLIIGYNNKHLFFSFKKRITKRINNKSYPKKLDKFYDITTYSKIKDLNNCSYFDENDITFILMYKLSYHDFVVFKDSFIQYFYPSFIFQSSMFIEKQITIQNYYLILYYIFISKISIKNPLLDYDDMINIAKGFLNNKLVYFSDNKKYKKCLKILNKFTDKKRTYIENLDKMYKKYILKNIINYLILNKIKLKNNYLILNNYKLKNNFKLKNFKLKNYINYAKYIYNIFLFFLIKIQHPTKIINICNSKNTLIIDLHIKFMFMLSEKIND